MLRSDIFHVILYIRSNIKARQYFITTIMTTHLKISTISTTSNVYSHVDSESKKMSAEAIAKALSNESAEATAV